MVEFQTPMLHLETYLLRDLRLGIAIPPRPPTQSLTEYFIQ